MARWRRVAPLVGAQAITLTFAACCGALAVVLTVVLVSSGRVHLLVIAPIAVLLLAAAGAWRASRIGVYVSDLGVRSRLFLATRTLPWSEVARFEDRPVPQEEYGWARLLLFPGRAVWIVPKDGPAIMTGLMYPSPYHDDFPPEDTFAGQLSRFIATLNPVRERHASTMRMAPTRELCRTALSELQKAQRAAHPPLSSPGTLTG